MTRKEKLNVIEKLVGDLPTVTVFGSGRPDADDILCRWSIWRIELIGRIADQSFEYLHMEPDINASWKAIMIHQEPVTRPSVTKAEIVSILKNCLYSGGQIDLTSVIKRIEYEGIVE